MIREHFEVRETAVTLISERRFMKFAKDAVFDARSQIEHKISQDPFFGTTYEPYRASPNDGIVVKRMCEASIKAGVGPMAAVAGAIAAYAVESMAAAGASYAIADNGGDIALINDRDVCIGMYADIGGQRLSLRIPPCDHVIGICSSSGSVGPSVSFGTSEISTVFSDDTALADACATALGNSIGDGNEMKGHLERICTIDGVNGCLAYCGRSFAMCGDIPELVRSDANDHIITKIRFS